MSLWLVLAAGIFIAYVNGANDVSKGIATLAGSGVTNYRRAILWGSLWTGIGGLAAFSLAKALLTTFGRGVFAAGTTPTFPVALAIILGAGAWVALATFTGLPVSTTHAIVGAMTGVAAWAYGLHGVNWGALVSKIALPLALSPLVSIAVTMGLLRILKFFSGTNNASADCICAELEPAKQMELVAAGAAGLQSSGIFAAPPQLHLTVAPAEACAMERPRAFRVTVDHLHWLTSGATSFARGLNDAPKMAAILLAAVALSSSPFTAQPAAFVAVTLGIVVGSLVGGYRVTAVLAEKVTRMNHQEGFLANLVTAALVGSGAFFGLPMSTTHVSGSAIMGVGLRSPHSIHWGTVRNMLLAWVITLPVSGAFGVLIYLFIRRK
jgi:inorganic phosphate transporter, PiT family